MTLPSYCPRIENDGAAAAALDRIDSALDESAVTPIDNTCSLLVGLALGEDDDDDDGRHS